MKKAVNGPFEKPVHHIPSMTYLTIGLSKTVIGIGLSRCCITKCSVKHN